MKILQEFAPQIEQILSEQSKLEKQFKPIIIELIQKLAKKNII